MLVRSKILLIVLAAILSPALSRESHVQRVTEALRSGQPGKAATLLEVALQEDPNNPVLWTLQGMTFQQLGKPHEALSAFHHALEHQPDYLPAHLGAAQIEYESGDAEADIHLQTILEHQPGNSTAHAMTAVLYYERGDYRGAAQHFEKSADQLSGNPLARWQYGESLLRCGEPEKASRVFRELLDSKPRDPQVRFNLALSFFHTGSFRQSIEILEPLAHSEQPNPETLRLLSDCYLASGDIASSLEVLQRAIRLYPTQARHYLDLAILCFDQGSFTLGAEIASIGIQNIPDSAPLYATRGIINAQLGSFEDAKRDFEKANQLEPEKPYGGLGLSMALKQSGEVAEAIDLLRLQLSRFPDDPDRLYLLAETLIESGLAVPGGDEFREAERSLLRVLELIPDMVRALVELGKLRMKADDTSGAIDYLQKAVNREPTDRPAINQLLLALRKAGRIEEANEYAAKLGRLMKQEREDEVNRNRYRLVKAPTSEQGKPE